MHPLHRHAPRLTVLAALLAGLPAMALTVITERATLTLSSPASVTEGPITYVGNGTMLFTGSFQLANPIVFNSGVTGTINTNGQDDVLTGVLSGAGALRKSGDGTLTLTAANTYSGGTALWAGTLAVGNSAALGTGAVTITGGTLLGAADATLANSLSFSGHVGIAAAAGTTFSVGSGGWTADAGTGLTFGSAGSTGTVLWQAGSSPAFAGAVNLAGGTLKGDAGTSTVGLNRLLSGASAFTLASGATLDLAGTSATLPAGFSGGGRITTSSGASVLTTQGGSFAGAIDGVLRLKVLEGAPTILTGASTYSGGTLIFNNASVLQLGDGGDGGSITGNVVNSGSLVVNQRSNVTLDGVISDTGSVGKLGTGTLTLTGSNTYSGGTTLSAGTLAVASSAALGTGTLKQQGGTLLGVADVALGNALSFTGKVGVAAAAGSTLGVGTGGWTLGANTTLTIGSAAATGTVLWNGPATGIASPVTQTLVIAGGTLKGADNAILNVLLQGVGALKVESGGTLDFAGGADVLPAQLSGSGRITGSGTVTQLYTQGGSFAGVLDGALKLSQISGTLTLTGTNLYTGLTTILAGSVLQLGDGGTGGSLASATVGNNGSLVVNQSGESRLAGVIAGSGSLSHLGGGTFILTGANTFTGGTTNAAGSTLQLGDGTLGATLGDVANAGTLVAKGGSGGTVTVGTVTQTQAGSTFSLQSGSLVLAGSGITADNFSLGAAAGASASFELAAGKTLTTAAASVGITGTLTVSGLASIASSLDNRGSLALAGGTLAGAGTLVNRQALSGWGSIAGTGGFGNSGQLTVSGGSLTLSNTGTNINSGSWDIGSRLSLELSGATLGNAGVMNLGGGRIAGSGTLNNLGSGTLAGRGTVAAGFSNAGVLAASGGSLLLDGAASNLASGRMTAGAGSSLTVSQGLSGNAGSIQLAGGSFDNGGHALANTGQIAGWGSFSASAFDNSASMAFSGGATVVNGDLGNRSGASLSVSGAPATFTGNVVNNGTMKVTATTVTFSGSFTNNGLYVSDPATQVFQDLTLGPQGALQGALGDVFIVQGNLANHSQAGALFDIAAARLLLTSGPHSLVWGASDAGATLAGYAQNFAVGTFELAVGGSLNLSGAGPAAGGQALYVHSLLLDGGLAQLGSIQSTLNIYYDAADAGNAYLQGASYSLAGGGLLQAVAAVPEPEVQALWLAGLGSIAILRRRRSSAPRASRQR
jgi:autotransporter-associated beta strand protein